MIDKLNNLEKLIDLKLSLENNLINDIEFDINNLVDLELNLKDNYIDNIRFEELM